MATLFPNLFPPEPGETVVFRLFQVPSNASIFPPSPFRILSPFFFEGPIELLL